MTRLENMFAELTETYQNTLASNSILRQTLTCAMAKLGMTLYDVLLGFLRYDGDIRDLDNDVYEDMRVRAALFFKYFLPGSYHVERQRMLSEYVRHCGAVKTMVDIGYGAPGLYIGDEVLTRSEVSLTLLDKFESAEIFSRALISCAYPQTSWEKQIRFDVFDFDLAKSPGSFDVYVMFDSIEHANDPTASMDLIVQNAPVSAQFVLSLPICSKKEIADMHFIEWLTEQSAIDWLKERGLNIVERHIIAPTPVDTWAEHFSFRNLIVRCVKTESLH